MSKIRTLHVSGFFFYFRRPPLPCAPIWLIILDLSITRNGKQISCVECRSSVGQHFQIIRFSWVSLCCFGRRSVRTCMDTEPKRVTATGTMADNINESTRTTSQRAYGTVHCIYVVRIQTSNSDTQYHTGRCARPIAYGQIQICCVDTHRRVANCGSCMASEQLVVRQRCMQRVLYIQLTLADVLAIDPTTTQIHTNSLYKRKSRSSVQFDAEEPNHG